MQLNHSLQRHKEELEEGSFDSQAASLPASSLRPRVRPGSSTLSDASHAPSLPVAAAPSTLTPSASAGDANNEEDEESDSDTESDPPPPNNDPTRSPILPKSKTVLASQKYNISPPPTPPPSTLFPEYFIPRNTKMLEQVSYPRSHLTKHRLQEIALFSRCKISFVDNSNRPPSTSPPPPHLALSSPVTPTASPALSPKPRRSVGIATSPPPLPLPSAADHLTLQLHGQPDQRELAKLLLEAATKPNHYRSPGYSQKDGLDGVVRTMDCPPHFIPVLIGPGGATIESIKSQSNTKILINENVDADRPPTLSIIGTVTGVDAAVQILDRLVMNHRFKYRQMKAAVLTESSRARSLPIMRSNRDQEQGQEEEYEEGEYEEEEVDELQEEQEHEKEGKEEGEEGGRTLLTPSPIPLKQSAGAALAMMSNQKRLHNLAAARNQLTTQPSNSSASGGMMSRQSSLSTISDCSSLELSRSSSNVSVMHQGSSSPPWNSPQSSPMRSVMSSDSKSLMSSSITSPRDLSQYSVEATLYCPMEKVAQVIGKRGSILRELKRLSSCEIIVNQGTLS
jgi:rRNA processing protein Krr1/Pno1